MPKPEIPERSLGLEMLRSIAIMVVSDVISIAVIVVSAVLKNFVVFYFGIWLLFLGYSLDIVKEINRLKEDLRSPDLKKRRATMEIVKSYEQDAVMDIIILLTIAVLTILFGEAPGAFTLAKAAIAIALLFASPIPSLIVYEQAYKVMPPAQPREVGA